MGKKHNDRGFYRAIATDVTAGMEEGIIEALPVVFNSYSVHILDWCAEEEFREIILPHALDETDLSDVLLLVNHEESMIPLARTREGGNGGLGVLDLKVTDKGLHVSTKLDIENSVQAREIYTAVKNGIMRGMSFCFYLKEGDSRFYRDEDDVLVHEISRIRMISEVSIVTHPAYPSTEVSTRQKRSLENDKAELESFLNREGQAKVLRERIRLAR